MDYAQVIFPAGDYIANHPVPNRLGPSPERP